MPTLKTKKGFTMGFKINTNIAAMNSHSAALLNNRELDLSLGRLSTGLRINSAADDASGMVIADTLKSQANSLGQAIKNANDAIGIVQIADKAMDEQIKILDTIKTKATQAAADGQSSTSRSAIQEDIVKLMAELDNIAQTTSFNGLSLLSGGFANKEFQIGAYSHETIKLSIGNTSSATIGAVRTETSGVISSAVTSGMVFYNADGSRTTIAKVTISSSVGTGLGALAEAINRVSDTTGVRASARVELGASAAVAAGTLRGLVINGITIGTISTSLNDSNGNLRNAINAVTTQTGVNASIDASGKLTLTSQDGRGIIAKTISSSVVTGMSTRVGIEGSAMSNGVAGANYGSGKVFMGRITLTSLNAGDIRISGGGSIGTTAASFMHSGIFNKMNYSAGAINATSGYSGSQAATFSTMNLRQVAGAFSNQDALAMGNFGSGAMSAALHVGANGTAAQKAANQNASFGAGVTTRAGAMMVMDIAESAMKMLDKIRAGIGSSQQQLTSTINNITVTQVNVTAAESQIRDVDFAAESANFSKRNLLAQSGAYAMSQANQVQQNVMRLLQ